MKNGRAERWVGRRRRGLGEHVVVLRVRQLRELVRSGHRPRLSSLTPALVSAAAVGDVAQE